MLKVRHRQRPRAFRHALCTYSKSWIWQVTYQKTSQPYRSKFVVLTWARHISQVAPSSDVLYCYVPHWHMHLCFCWLPLNLLSKLCSQLSCMFLVSLSSIHAPQVYVLKGMSLSSSYKSWRSQRRLWCWISIVIFRIGPKQYLNGCKKDLHAEITARRKEEEETVLTSINTVALSSYLSCSQKKLSPSWISNVISCDQLAAIADQNLKPFNGK